MKWIGQHIFDLKSKFRNDVTIDGDLTVSGTYTQIDTDVTTTEQWLVTNDGTGPAAIINQKGSQDIFDVQDDGTSVFYIEDGGNVGIGTTSPNQKLDVAGAINIQDGYTLRYNNSSNISILGSSSTGLTYTGIEHHFKAYDGSSSYSEYMTIDTGGNVGIGTTSPTSKLTISGVANGDNFAEFKNANNILKAKIGLTSNSSGELTLIDGNNVSNVLLSSRGNVNSYINAGNVGIGTTSPASLLHIAGTVQVGVDDTGHDVKFFGATSGRYLLWDESSDLLLHRDNVKSTFGNASDLQIFHDASNSYIYHGGTGNLYIKNETDDQDVVLQCDDGSGGITAYLTLDGGLGYTTVQKRIKFDDNTQLQLGGGGDLQLYHVSNQSYIDNSTGNLNIRQKADDGDIIFQSDDGSGGTETYFFLDGSLSSGNPYTVFPDDSILTFGNSQDLQFKHSGGYSYIDNTAGGDLVIRQFVDDKDIIFQCDDGSGGVQTYLTIDGSLEVVNVPDTIYLGAGNSFDLSLRHDGSNSHIQNNTGNLTIKNGSNDSDIIFQCDDGSGGLATYFTLDGGAVLNKFYKSSKHLDNVVAMFGDGEDLQLSHDASNSHIVSYNGDLKITQNANDKDIIFNCDDGSGGNTAYLTLDGSTTHSYFSAGNVGIGTTSPGQKLEVDEGYINVTGAGTSHGYELERDGLDTYKIRHLDGGLTIYNSTDSRKEMTFDGAGNVGIGTASPASLLHVAGTVQVGVDDTGHDVRFYGATSGKYMQWDESQDRLEFTDTTEVVWGTDGDLNIVHDGTSGKITEKTGHLYIRTQADDKDVILQSDDGSGGTTAYLTLDGSSTNIKAHKNLYVVDDILLGIGSGFDMRMYHDGSNSFIRNDTGNLTIFNNTNDGDIIFQSDDGSGGVTAYLTLDGSAGTIEAAKDITVTKGSATIKVEESGGADVRMVAGGSTGYIGTYSNDQVYIMQNSASAITIDTNRNATFAGDVTVGDDVFIADGGMLMIGDSNDLRIYHDGSDSYVRAYGATDLVVMHDHSDRDIKFKGNDGGSTITALTLDMSAAGALILNTPLATDQQKHLAWFEIAGFGTGDGTNYEISVNLDNDTAPFSHNVSTGADGTTAITVQNIMRSGGTVIPQAGTIKRWKGWATTAGSSTANVALFKITPARNDNSDVAPVLIDNVSYTAVGNAKMLDFDETSFTDASVAAGDIVVTGIKCEDTKTTYFSSTLEIEF